jgi:hypothetical protein
MTNPAGAAIVSDRPDRQVVQAGTDAPADTWSSLWDRQRS